MKAEPSSLDIYNNIQREYMKPTGKHIIVGRNQHQGKDG